MLRMDRLPVFPPRLQPRCRAPCREPPSTRHMHAHDVPAWAGGSAQQKPPDNPFQAPKPDGPNPFATASQQSMPLSAPAKPEGTDNPFATARPEGTDNPFATARRPEGTDNPFATRSIGDAPAPITASKQAAAPAARPAPPPTSRPWKGCCGITPWQGCIGCVCIGMSCSFIGAFVLRTGHWAAFGVIFSLDAIASIGAMVPPRRTAAPPHHCTAAPLHLCTSRSSSPARASTAAASLPTGRGGHCSASPTGVASC